jgi:hypothetical protein
MTLNFTFEERRNVETALTCAVPTHDVRSRGQLSTETDAYFRSRSLHMVPYEYQIHPFLPCMVDQGPMANGGPLEILKCGHGGCAHGRVLWHGWNGKTRSALGLPGYDRAGY